MEGKNLTSNIVCDCEQAESSVQLGNESVCLQSKTAFLGNDMLTDSVLLIMKRCFEDHYQQQTHSGGNKLRLVLIFK